jgi:hypothetical protein
VALLIRLFRYPTGRVMPVILTVSARKPVYVALYTILIYSVNNLIMHTISIEGADYSSGKNDVFVFQF